MNIKGKPGANSLVRKCEWCYILHLSFTVDGLNEWIADICLGLQVFVTAGQFSTDRILRERQRQDACSILKNEFLCPNIILWLGLYVCWSRTSKITHPEVRFVNILKSDFLKDSFTYKRFAVHSAGPAFTTTCLWPRIWLVSHWARLAISRLSSSLS